MNVKRDTSIQLSVKRAALVAAAASLGWAICTTAPASAEPQDGGAVMGGPVSGSVKAIALAPDDGPLGAALAREFRNRGYTILGAGALASSPSLAELKAQGVDAVLTVRTAGAEDQPQAASAQINSTATGAVLAKITWQNGWSGWRGSKASPAGRITHKTLAQAAREIADDLTRTPL